MSVDQNQEQNAAFAAHAVAPSAQVEVHTPPYVNALPPAAAEYPPAPVYAPAFEPVAPAAVVAAPRKSRPAWIAPAAIAAVGLIASGALGYLFYSTNTKLESTQHQLTETQLTLDTTQKSLDGQKAQASYVQIVDTDMAREGTDYALVTACDSYSACHSATQTMLTDTQSFQSDLQSAKTPTSFTNAQSMLSDSLSAEITALKSLLAAIESRDMNKIQAGFTTVNDASLSLFKSESALARMIA
jgi:hypothetical protein